MIDEAELTALLQRCNAGEQGAEANLMQATFATLHDLARSRLRRFSNSQLCPGELVSETYLRLRWGEIEWHGPAHFMAMIAQAMRNVVIDHDRAQQSEKRGGGVAHVPFEVLDLVADDADPYYVLARSQLHDRLGALRRIDRRRSRVAELKILCGLTTKEIARDLTISRTAVVRLWRETLAYLAASGERDAARQGRTAHCAAAVVAGLAL